MSRLVIPHRDVPSEPVASRLRPTIAGTYGRYLAAWLGMALLGPANGIVRELAYRGALGEQRSHQLSSITAIAIFATYATIVGRRWRIARISTAAAVGAMSLAMTIAFEFGFGRFVDHKSWSTLLADYNLPAGRLWPLVLATIAVAPAAVRIVLGPDRGYKEVAR